MNCNVNTTKTGDAGIRCAVYPIIASNIIWLVHAPGNRMALINGAGNAINAGRIVGSIDATSQ